MESIIILVAAHLAATLSRWEPRPRWQKRVRTAGRIIAHLAALGGIGWLFYGTPVVEALTPGWPRRLAGRAPTGMPRAPRSLRLPSRRGWPRHTSPRVRSTPTPCLVPRSQG
ncbi:hypothetical protein [Nostocoides veronense]|uniref:Uncharacterized protein n=1 Tax=Nostocoides veronense TaxID=330836 RepID=A0ABN2LMC4_9MICO